MSYCALLKRKKFKKLFFLGVNNCHSAIPFAILSNLKFWLTLQESNIFFLKILGYTLLSSFNFAIRSIECMISINYFLANCFLGKPGACTA